MIYQFFINAYIATWLIDFFIIRNSGKLKYYKANTLTIDDFMIFEKFLTRFGCVLNKDIFTYSVMMITIPVIGIFAMLYLSFLNGLVLVIGSYTVLMITVISKKKSLEKQFCKNSYKLYKYMLNQIEAGVLPKDALLSIHEIVGEKELFEVLRKACAAYQFTLNPKSASEYIKKYIRTQEASSFAMFIENIAFEGGNIGVTERLEQLMFNRYFSYLQRATDGMKTKSMITAIVFCAIIVIMIMVPMYMDVQDALKSIFS
ncbi:MAG: hypothetical protein JXQ23_02285 [Clostridia bacterium]|nr:hypothetical protein [Clostridia bacterium]